MYTADIDFLKGQGSMDNVIVFISRVHKVRLIYLLYTNICFPNYSFNEGTSKKSMRVLLSPWKARDDLVNFLLILKFMFLYLCMSLTNRMQLSYTFLSEIFR